MNASAITLYALQSVSAKIVRTYSKIHKSLISSEKKSVLNGQKARAVAAQSPIARRSTATATIEEFLVGLHAAV